MLHANCCATPRENKRDGAAGAAARSNRRRRRQSHWTTGARKCLTARLVDRVGLRCPAPHDWGHSTRSSIRTISAYSLPLFPSFLPAAENTEICLPKGTYSADQAHPRRVSGTQGQTRSRHKAYPSGACTKQIWKRQNRTFAIRFAHHNALFEHEGNHITSLSACVLGALVAGWLAKKKSALRAKKRTLLYFKYVELLSGEQAIIVRMLLRVQ